MKRTSKRLLAIIVCISFILTILPVNSVSFAKPRYDVWKDKIKVYDSGKKLKTAEAEYEGYKYIATLDKDTNEIKLKVKPTAAKKFEKSFDISGSEEERNFSVKVEYFDGENLKAKLIDEKTNEEYNIGDSDTVTAQFVIALPIAIELSEVLIAILLASLSVIVIGGYTYVVVNEIIEKIKTRQTYDYYMSVIRFGKVFVGPAISKEEAIIRIRTADLVLQLQKDEEKAKYDYNVFCRTKEIASALAVSTHGNYVLHSPHKDSPFYFPHYHGVLNSTKLAPAHMFFP
ncbi:hypothetical protein [Anaerocellum danielii]|uniref:Cell wall hydrolase SleB domain-containing protein n=1 Tax=Anaerocellum danielii TaxID=1387557 RepID=A0ABZ0U2Z1_9FIRM|nr:hypothetical protein [Caldicellulosiruptor danielii]WPX09093.1 hypothetical protein SOJ16_000267 [Caldicellulosiruptor danielii]